MQSINYVPIGVVRSPHTDPTQTPKQTESARGIEGRVELNAELADPVTRAAAIGAPVESATRPRSESATSTAAGPAACGEAATDEDADDPTIEMAARQIRNDID